MEAFICDKIEKEKKNAEEIHERVNYISLQQAYEVKNEGDEPATRPFIGPCDFA